METFLIPGITQPQLSTKPIYSGSHFTWDEATDDGTRLPVDTYFDGSLIKAAQITSNMIKVAKMLDGIRADFGDNPITVTSWYRPPTVNRRVGGVANSQHLLGWAVDIQITGFHPHQVAARLDSSWDGGLGDSDAFTHLDLRYLMGRSAARWDYGYA